VFITAESAVVIQTNQRHKNNQFFSYIFEPPCIPTLWDYT